MDMEGKRMNLGVLKIFDDELSPRGCLDEAHPDESRCTDYKGNEGSNYDEFYHYAGLLVWKEGGTFSVVNQNGPNAAATFLS